MTLMAGHSAPPDPEYVLRGSDGEVTAVEFLQDGTLISASLKGTIMKWDLEKRRPVHTMSGHAGHSVLWLHQVAGKEFCLLSQGRDGWVHQWDMGCAGWEKTVSLQYAGMGFCNCTQLLLGNHPVLAVPCDNSAVNLVSLETKEIIQSLQPDKNCSGYGMCMAIRPIETDGSDPRLCIGYEDGNIALWDLKTSKEMSKLACHKEAVMSFDYCAQVNRGISGSVDNNLIMWSLQNSSGIEKVRDCKITNPGVNCVCIRKDGKVFATGGWDSRCRMFGVKRCKPLAVLSFHTGSVLCLAFGPDNSLALGSKDGHISLWALYK